MSLADAPLTVYNESDQQLVIRIGINRLKDAAESGPAFWGYWPGAKVDGPWAVVADPVRLAEDVRRELLREREDGATPLCHLFDQALRDAYDDGSEAFGDR